MFSQSTLQHFIELRARLLKCCYVLGLVSLISFYYSNQLYFLLSKPMLAVLPQGFMIATSITSPLVTPLKLSFMVAMMICVPYILYQIWAYIAPGLYSREQRFVLRLLVPSIVLFYLGVLFAYFIVFPFMFGFFARAVPQSVQLLPDMNQYLEFTLGMFLAFGIVFEVPIITVVLVTTGLMSRNQLASMRPYFIVIAFTVGMLLTPPDVLSQVLLAVPMCLLFEFGLFLCSFFQEKKVPSPCQSDG